MAETIKMPVHYYLHSFLPILITWGWIILTVIAKPPPPPVGCDQTGCTLKNAYGVWGDRKECRAATVKYPTTEEEFRSAIALATQNKLKVKVVSKFSHTIPKLACPDSKFNNSILLSTEKYNSRIEIDGRSLTVTVDSGVGLRQLIDKVEEAGLSLVASPYWEGVSVGGVVSTGSHGSSWWGKGGSVHDHVVGMSLIVPAGESEGFAKVIRLEEKDELLHAAKVSLGILGFISKVKLSLEREFKRSITYNFTDDDHIEDLFMQQAKKYEFADITWFPSKHTAAYRYDNRAPSNVAGNGVFDFLGFQPNSVLVSKSIRASEKALDNAKNTIGKCLLASTVLNYKKLIANGLKDGLIFTGYPVIGHQSKMQTSGSCLYSNSSDKTCAWDPIINGLFFYETTAIFPPSNFKSFIQDVKTLRNLNPENLCGVDLYNGFLIRFIKASKAYLGQAEDSIVVDFNYFRSDEASIPRLNQDVWEEVEQMAFFKHGAKPHWAKNRNLAFLGVGKKYGNFKKFVEAKRELDAGNMFSSEWSDEIVFGRKEMEKSDGCALEGLCVCSEDRHCSPGNGYLCKQGLVYKEARVCRYSAASDN